VFWSISENPAAAFNARGQLQRSRLGNGLETDNAYDLGTGVPLNLRTGTVTAVGGAVTSNTHHALSYRFDANLNPTERVNGATNLREEFAYDLQNRLTDYRIRPSDTAQNRDMRVVYNAIGNILFKTGSGIYTYNASGASSVRPHAVTNVGGTTYNYDANGHLETTTGTLARTHTWTAFNQPARLSANGTTMDFKYDADYQRMERVTTTGTTVRRLYMLHPDNAGGLSFERELTFNNGTLTQTENRHYINTPAGVVAVVKTFGADLAAATATPSADPTHIQYWHKDHLGSVVLVTNANGAVAERTSFDAWGARLRGDGFNFAANDPARNPAHGDRGYTGHEHLDELGVIHMNGRIYDPILGRFFSPDPFIQAPDMLATYNRYSYVLNRPMSMTDPTGEIAAETMATLKVIAAIVGAVMVSEGNKHWKLVGSVLMAWGMGTQGGLLESGVGITSAAARGAITGAAVSAAGGASEDQIFISAITGGALGAISNGLDIGTLTDRQAVLAHALVSCVQASASGGDCGSAAMAGAFGKAAGALPFEQGSFASFVGTAIVGGTASVIGGGRFSNGAATAAMNFVLNQLQREIHHWHDQAITRKLDQAGLLTKEAKQYLLHNHQATTVIYQDPKDPNTRFHRYDAMHRAASAEVRQISAQFVVDNKITAKNPMTSSQASRLVMQIRASNTPALAAYRSAMADYLLNRGAQAKRNYHLMLQRGGARGSR
jgi:RHS repeat-associated protein